MKGLNGGVLDHFIEICDDRSQMNMEFTMIRMIVHIPVLGKLHSPLNMNRVILTVQCCVQHMYSEDTCTYCIVLKQLSLLD